MKRLLMAIILASVPLAAHAQFGAPNGPTTIFTPGQPPTFYNPNPNGGGGAFTTPGQPQTFYNPNPIGGGGTLTTPGQPTTFINPNPPFGR
jgi:hypothetical protein